MLCIDLGAQFCPLIKKNNPCKNIGLSQLFLIHHSANSPLLDFCAAVLLCTRLYGRDHHVSDNDPAFCGMALWFWNSQGSRVNLGSF